MNRAKDLIEKLASNPGSSDLNVLANDLLNEYHRGSSLQSLRSLLQSSDEKLTEEGAWIASELGEVGKPLLPVMGPLLSHTSKIVRFWSLDCVLMWAGSANGSELASAVFLLQDSEPAVRWKAMVFLASASAEQLEAARAWLNLAFPASSYASGLEWLLGREGSDAAMIDRRLHDKNSLQRKVAAAAAVRIAGRDSGPLANAAISEDLEVVQFAQDMLKRAELR